MKENNQKRMGRWKLLAVIAVCAAPLIASYLTYYVIKPQGRTNYGVILDPRLYSIPVMVGTSLDGKSTSLNTYKGKWIMLQVDGAECLERCKTKLLQMRQLRLMQGKERDRIERVWFITDKNKVDASFLREYEGTHTLRVDPESIKKWLPAEIETTIEDHIFMIDPLGNLMMRFPKNADPSKVKKDITKLLKASSIG